MRLKMSARLYLWNLQKRWFSSKEKMKILDNFDELLTKKELKHRHHPGIIKPRGIEVPKWILKAAKEIIEEEKLSKQGVLYAGEQLDRHLNGRHPPQEGNPDEIGNLYFNCDERGKNDKGETQLPPRTRLEPKTYNWQPIDYNTRTGLAYLSGRGIPDYLALATIFREIKHRDPDFKPRTLFDFGSGVGTVEWAAADYWLSTLKEYVCIDSSASMIELAERILSYRLPHVQTVFYRQHLPVAPVPTFDIVVSAYSLLELPSLKSRIDTISKLWLKTDQYLVIVERGTNAGFQIVNEARDFILNFATKAVVGAQDAHVFAPCPHEQKCPRYWSDQTPCNFLINYTTLPISGVAKAKHDLFSYIVLKKGHCPDESTRWPRIVRPVLKRSSHVVCRMCVSSGELKEEVVTTYKNGKNTYRCARSSTWGDRLPFETIQVPQTEDVDKDVCENELDDDEQAENSDTEECANRNNEK